MKKQITTWLFLLLLGSGYNIQEAQSQTVNQYPYEMTKEGWTLGKDFKWMQYSINDPGCGFTGQKGSIRSSITETYTMSPSFNFGSIDAPECTFTGGGYQLEILLNGSVLKTITQKETKTTTIFFDKSLEDNSGSNLWQLKFSILDKQTLRVEKLTVKGENEIKWVTNENGEYTLKRVENIPEGSSGTVWLPEITIPSGESHAVTFDVTNLEPDKVQLYLVQKKYGNLIKETEITNSGRATILIQESIIPGFKAVSKGESAPAVKISNFKALKNFPFIQTNLNAWYDEDRNGVMDFCAGIESSRWWKDYGKYTIIDHAIVRYDGFPEGLSTLYPYNINNDNAIDFYGGIRKGVDTYYYDYKIYTNNEQGETKISQDSEGNYTSTFVPCDYNNDGLTDFLLSDNRVAVQLIDGSFKIHQLKVFTQEEYRNRDKTNDTWSQNGNYSGVVSQNRNDAFLSGSDMFIGGDGKYTGSMGYQASNIDFNKDGLPDLVNTGTGQVLLYIAKDQYVSIPMGGAIYFRDLNNDQRPDYIVYEPNTKTVTSHVYQADGTEKEQKLISNLSMDQQIWCYDFDKDGDVDILLPFSYQSSNGAAFLVVMENDGSGKFKMHESSFEEELEFVACTDIDHDGFYDIVAKLKTDNAAEIHLLKGNNKMKFQLNTEPLIHLDNPTPGRSSDLTCLVADINNDGINEILIAVFGLSYVYSMQELIPETTRNQAPQKPEKPSYLFEPATGFLKVSWQQGKDAESSPVDLTYALRIGTQPGKGNIYYANAMEDGTRLNLLDGNMGYNLDRIIDASGWNAEKYYIAIQTIDPMHNGSAWSEEAIFEKTQLGSGFRLTDERTVGDTITLALTAPKDLSIEYKWDMAGATVISQSNNGSVYQIQFAAPGQKHISLQTTNAKGELSAVTDESIYIFPNKLALDTLVFTPDGIGGTYTAVDLDGDGTMELLTGNGVYEYDSKDAYTKIKKIYNTNLSFSNGVMYTTDVNKDGLPDIVFSAYDSNQRKNFIHHYINEGEKTLSDENHEHSDLGYYNYDIEAYFDFNHDGYMDFKDTFDNFLINSGNDLDFIDYKNSEYHYYDVYFHFMVDLNKDGFLDNVHKNCKNNTVETYICNNKGTYLEKLIPITDVSHLSAEESFTISAVADMNNDGYPDLIIQKNAKTILIAFNNKNEAFNEVKEIILPIELNDVKIGKVFDFDNNGFLDIALNSSKNASILYFYNDLETEMMNFGNNRNYYNGIGEYEANLEIDLNGDSSPDFMHEGWGTTYFRNSTTATNTRPEAPTNIRSAQTKNLVTLQWDPAKDAETSYAQMRYNISVKKQGATGEGAYIISPMNDLKAEAAIIPNYVYPNATTYSIPLSVLPAGNYEVQIQAIDGWNATSAFTEAYILKVEANPQMQVPTAVCVGSSATVTYTGNASTSGLTWNWDGGELLYQSGENYEVVWKTEGKKQISVTSNGVTSTAEVWVAPAINPAFTINDQALLVSETPMTLPEGNYEFSWEISKDGSEFKALEEYRVPPVRIVRNGNTNEAKATFMGTGNYVLRLNVYAPCGVATCERNTVVTDELDRQQIDLITIDPTTGKYNISWQYATKLPAFVTNVKVYKEGSKYNDFRLLATVPVSQTSYIDVTSNPQISASRYRLALETNYGAETTPGTPHQGVHAMLNKGVGNGWNVFWSQYEGATIETYRILRGTTPDNLSVIAEISGNATSYSDLNASEGTLYYALDFDARYEDSWNPMKAARQTRANEVIVRSNVVSTEGAANVIFAESILLRSVEEPTLSPDQVSIQLVADIYPLTATFRAINWTIVSGNDIATISQSGVLTANGNKNGLVTVRVSAIDGSDIYSEITISVNNMTAIHELEKDKDGIITYPAPVIDYLHIQNMSENNENKIYIFSTNGQMIHTEKTTDSKVNIACSSYPAGIYILKVITEDRVITRQFIKK